jgi:sugar lactone lactonase YvrE
VTRTTFVAALMASAALLTGAAVAPQAGLAQAGPDVIDLPEGFQPEGIAAGPKGSLFVGSIPTGEVRRVDPRAGTTETLVAPRPGVAAAIGLEADFSNNLFVAGGPTGKAFIYDATTGAEKAALQLSPDPETFINDVAVSGRWAYFTDSRRQAIFAVARDGSAVREIPTPDIPLLPGFNLNGITATKDPRFLLAVQTGSGTLWRIDARSGAAVEVDLGGATLANGDGLLLRGRNLYVVQNRSNQVAVVFLATNYRSGTVTRTLGSPLFDVPTTIAQQDGFFYLPNARFGIPSPETAAFAITRIPFAR